MLKRRIRSISSLLLVICIAVVSSTFFLSSAQAQITVRTQTAPKDTTTQEDLSSYFKGYDDATFVLYNEKAHAYTVYNEALSATRMSPFSTFKIANSLIGLETGVLKDENTVFKWDGFHYQFDSWNHDQTMASAIQNSVVWYYQRVAAEVGRPRMQFYVNLMNYGNKDLSGTLIDFWLNSSLKISPMEQVRMLIKLHNNALPFSQRSMSITRKILLQDEQDGVKLYGKTGTNGWFVGYLESGSNTYYFATKLGKDLKPGEPLIFNGSVAKAITISILHDKHLYPGQAPMNVTTPAP